MALTIGVMGGAGRDIPEAYLAKAEELGEAVTELVRGILREAQSLIHPGVSSTAGEAKAKCFGGLRSRFRWTS